VVELGIVEAASDSTIQRALKKTLSKTSMSHCGAARAFFVAIWSGEFGPNNGAFPTFSALATLAYDCRHTSPFPRDPGIWQFTRSATMKVSQKT